MSFRLLSVGVPLSLVLIACGEPILLQSVDINGKMASTEGGEAELYLLSRDPYSSKRCRIAATHYGEAGKVAYVFEFGEELRDAEYREYRYRSPLSVDPAGQIESVKTEKMGSSREGLNFSDIFFDYRSLFDIDNLDKCGDFRGSIEG
jgi:hypothetical protein